MANQLENYINGTQQKDTRKPFYIKLSILIHRLSTQYRDNPKLLLNALVNPKNKTLYEEIDITIEKEDVQLAASVEIQGNDDGNVIYKDISEENDSDTANDKIQTRSRTALKKRIRRVENYELVGL